MTRGILIAGNESSLFSAVAAEAVKRVESFASVFVPNRLPLPEGRGISSSAVQAVEGAIPLPWNPASPISARTLVLAAENRLGQINDAILVCLPPAVFKSVETLIPEEIEILVNDQIKGWFFLLRELIMYFRKQKAGSLSLVTVDINRAGGKNAPVDLLGPSVEASFRAFAQSVLASQANEPFRTMGFAAAAGKEEAFAAWLFKLIDEGAAKHSGRWHKHSKLKLFR